jgi:hypothetical protein
LIKYFKNIKLTDRDKYLLTVFVACCVVVAWLAGEMIIHAGPDYRGKIISPTGEIIWCTDKHKQWKPTDGKC